MEELRLALVTKIGEQLKAEKPNIQYAKNIVSPAYAQQIVDLLNKALESDSACIDQLMTFCAVGHSKALAEHPTIQVRAWQDNPNAEKFTLSVLGLLNGLCTEDDLVASCHDDDGKLLRFQTVKRKAVN